MKINEKEILAKEKANDAGSNWACMRFRLGWMAILCLIFLMCGSNSPAFSQTRRQQFWALNGPMRSWVAMHPFAAQKGKRISVRALALTDSLRVAGSLGQDFNGGALDAFRHGIWMALLVQEMPVWKAKGLGRAHERGNRMDWRKGKSEDGGLQDAVARVMDLRNNAVGCEIGHAFRGKGENVLIQAVMDGIRGQQFFQISKNAEGESLDGHGQILPDSIWQGHWRNHRCVTRTH